jgi:hypothetical protein
MSDPIQTVSRLLDTPGGSDLRLDVYRIIMEVSAQSDSTAYCVAQNRLGEANEVIFDINLSLCENDVALGDLDDCRLLALVAADPSDRRATFIELPLVASPIHGCGRVCQIRIDQLLT